MFTSSCGCGMLHSFTDSVNGHRGWFVSYQILNYLLQHPHQHGIAFGGGGDGGGGGGRAKEEGEGMRTKESKGEYCPDSTSQREGEEKKKKVGKGGGRWGRRGETEEGEKGFRWEKMEIKIHRKLFLLCHSPVLGSFKIFFLSFEASFKMKKTQGCL